MSGAVAQRKRLLRVTAGNLRQSHIYINGHYDFFPKDAIGGANSRIDGNGRPIEIVLDGLGRTIKTDIGREPRSGKPRRFFRSRKWVREFFEHHDIKTGDVLAMEE